MLRNAAQQQQQQQQNQLNSVEAGKVAQQLAELVDANNNQLTATNVNSGMGSRMKKRFKLSKKVKHSLKNKVMPNKREIIIVLFLLFFKEYFWKGG